MYSDQKNAQQLTDQTTRQGQPYHIYIFPFRVENMHIILVFS